MNDIQETLDWHSQMGIRPIPLIGKRPFLKDFGLEHRRTLTAEDFINPWGRPHNIGWQLGPPSGNLCDLDMDTDDEDFIRIALDIYSDIEPFVYGKTPELASHIMFRVEGRPETSRKARVVARKDEHAFDLRLGGFNGREENGIPLVHQLQTFTIGKHPGTQKPLVWHNSPENIPTISWNRNVDLFEELCGTLEATIT